jgi:hypothetical protein
MCNKIKRKAGIKTAFLNTENIIKVSFNINVNRANQLMTSPNFISLFFDALKAWLTAISDMTTNK